MEKSGELKGPLPGLASGDGGLVPRGFEGWRRGWEVSPQVLEGARRPRSWGPQLACSQSRGKGLQMCEQGDSIRREQVVAFHTLEEPSPPS